MTAAGAAGPLSDAALLGMVQDGWSFARIADAWARAAEAPPHVSTVFAALSRAALAETTGHRYRECLPWRVRPEHQHSELARLLRLLGRRRAGLPLPARLEAELEAWLSSLAAARLLDAYDPHGGFHLVPASGQTRDEIPVRPSPQ